MAHEIESMMFVGATPWHGLGKRVVGQVSTREAIVAAGLDWEVGLKDLRTVDGEAVTHRASYRTSDAKILGVVGPAWHPLQNKDAFAFFDPFLAEGEAAIDTAGSLQGGKRIWVLAKLSLEPSVIVSKSSDVVEKFVLLSNSHDGSIAIRVGFTPVRVVCANTLALAHNTNASQLIRVRHTVGAVETLDRIRDVMNLANEAFEATAEQYRFLAGRECNAADLERFVRRIFPSAGKSRVFPRVVELFEKGRGNDLPGVRGTWWGAYNAVTEYLAHARGTDAERRLDSMWFGDGAAMNRNALSTAVELAA
jgi:phage/plasmid-like protein (TIGR03299 family)